MKCVFLSLEILVLGSLFIAQNSFAHVGGGPPFLKINGIYTPTNVLYFGVSKITVPQDIAPANYVVNQPISFFVDTTQLLLPPDIASQTTFRFTFDSTVKEYEYGTTLTHTYNKPKSYLLILDAKAPGQPDYVTIDTIQVNILSNKNYQFPHADFSIYTDKLLANRPIATVANPVVDPSTTIKSITWDFGDGTLVQDKTAQHVYQDIHDYATYPIVFRVVDNNGFIFDTGFIIQAVNNTWQFIDKNGRSDTLRASEKLPIISSSQIPSGNNFIWILGSIVGLISLSIFGVLFMRSLMMGNEKKIH